MYVCMYVCTVSERDEYQWCYESGHGGMMDRMDCQLLMITFNTFYYGNFIASKVASVDKMLYYVSMMRLDDKVALWEEVRTGYTYYIHTYIHTDIILCDVSSMLQLGRQLAANSSQSLY